jgi:hypothetical protein
MLACEDSDDRWKPGDASVRGQVGPGRRLGLRVQDARMNARFAPWVQEENGYCARPLLQSLVQRSRLPIGAESFGEGGGFTSIHGGEGP